MTWKATKSKIKVFRQELGFSLGRLIVTSTSLSASGILTYQVFFWLRDGEWLNLPALRLLEWVSVNTQNPDLLSWAENPGSWHAVHDLFALCPLWLFLALIGVLLAALVSQLFGFD
jgi:hypothetical protein